MIYYRCFLPDLTGFVIFRCAQDPAIANMAEREGFEPSVPLLGVHTISSRAPSASSVISPGNKRQFYGVFHLRYQIFFLRTIRDLHFRDKTLRQSRDEKFNPKNTMK